MYVKNVCSILIHNNQILETTQLYIERWINSQVMVFRRAEHDIIIKKNKLLIPETLWKNLRNVLLCERSKTQKNTFCMIPFTWLSRTDKLIYSDRKQSSGCPGLGRAGIWLERGRRKPFGVVEIFCAFIVVAITQICKFFRIYLLSYALKMKVCKKCFCELWFDKVFCFILFCLKEKNNNKGQLCNLEKNSSMSPR